MQFCRMGREPHIARVFSMNFNYTILSLKADIRNWMHRKLLIKHRMNNDEAIIQNLL